MVRAMCGMQLKGTKRSTDLMGLNKAIDQLDIANSVCYYCHAVSREDGHVLRALDFDVDNQRKKGRRMRTGKKQVEEESVKVGLSREDAK